MDRPPRPRIRVLGIDPGSRVTGFGIVERDGNRLVHVTNGALVVHKEAPSFEDRLVRIYEGLGTLIEQHSPNCVAVEGIYHHKNAQSALKLGHARGVALLAARLAGLDVFEYAPSQVKQSVVGYGRAEKQQVQKMIALLLGIPQPATHDASDALAVAICHCHVSASPVPRR